MARLSPEEVRPPGELPVSWQSPLRSSERSEATPAARHHPRSDDFGRTSPAAGIRDTPQRAAQPGLSSSLGDQALSTMATAGFPRYRRWQ
jgi:hypothetical protein